MSPFTFPATALLMLGGATALFLGTANPAVHIPLLIALYPACLYRVGLHSARPFRTGWLTGLIGASASLYWIAEAVHDYGYFPWIMAVPCSIFLGAYIGLWGGLFAKSVAAMRPQSPLRRCLAAALLWYLLEWARGWFGSGFPWLTLSGGLAAWPELIQSVSLVGAYGLSGILAGWGCLLAETLPPRIGAADRRVAALKPGLTAALLLAGLIGFGFWRMQTPSPVNPAESLGLLLIQGNVRQDVKWDPAFQQSTVDKYLNLSREALAGLPSKPAAVIWPETAMPFFYQDAADLGRRLRDFARETGVSLIFGGPGYARTTPEEAFLFNRAFFINPDGTNAGSYDKEHLVPFGEYVPAFLNFDIFKTLFQDVGGFQPGEDAAPFSLPAQNESADRKDARLGMLICYEAIFPELARERVAQGASVLVNISNDAWYNRTSAPTQHLQLTLLRAVEQGRWMARATNTGLTAFISPLGIVTPLTPVPWTDSKDLAAGLFIDGALACGIQPLIGRTVYFTLHPLLPALAFLALAVILLPLFRSIFFKAEQGSASRRD